MLISAPRIWSLLLSYSAFEFLMFKANFSNYLWRQLLMYQCKKSPDIKAINHSQPTRVKKPQTIILQSCFKGKKKQRNKTAPNYKKNNKQSKIQDPTKDVGMFNFCVSHYIVILQCLMNLNLDYIVIFTNFSTKNSECFFLIV